MVHEGDAQLWRAVCRGDHRAFDLVYERHQASVHQFLCRRVGADAADDLTAQAFLEAYQHRDRIVISPTGSLAGWLLGTAVNLARGHVRSSQYRAGLLTRLDVPGPQPDHAEEVVERLETRRQVALAERALAELPERDQELVALCVLGAVAPSEAAEIVGQPAATVRSRLTRVRRRLATNYERLAGEPADDAEGTRHD